MDNIVLQGREYRHLQPVAITASDGVIQSIAPLAPSAVTAELPIIAPGLVDLQVNGFAGHDFNHYPLSDTALTGATRRLWQTGVTQFLPTVITNGSEAIAQMVATIRQMIEQGLPESRSVAGIHLEGPFLSPEDGPRGAHQRQHIQPPSWSRFTAWQEAAHGWIKILTLSPEWPGAGDFILRCRAGGTLVSIGHTAADAQQIATAVAAGASMSTHLGNGAHLLLPRHPNYLWEQLAEDRLACAFIADGEHLPASVMRVFMRVKGERALIVSDATSLAGMPPGRYRTHIGGDVLLSDEGRLSVADSPHLLAGSAQPLLQGVNNLIRLKLAERAEAIDMASLRPARLLNLPAAAGLSPGAPLNAVLLEENAQGQLAALATLLQGERVWQRGA